MNDDEIYEGSDNGLNEESTPLNILGLQVPLTESLVQSILPNNLITVEGEDSLSTRIAPYVRDAEVWLSQELLGDMDPLLLSPQAADLSVRCIVMKAVISAIPALDLVVTPTGFGVVSADGLVPASKERIERLVAGLSSSLDGNLVSLFDILAADPLWREKDLASDLCSTFFRLRDALRHSPDTDIFSRFRELRSAGSELLAAVESRYLGLRLVRAMLLDYNSDPHGRIKYLVSPIKNASERYVRALKARPSGLPDDRDVWLAAQAVIEALPRFPELHEEWVLEMGHTVDIKPFKNTRKGGFFF